MDTKLYWIIRHWWKKLTFYLKKCWFSMTNKRYNEKMARRYNEVFM